MELLERYLQAVRFWLPKPQQDDIIEELRDDLHSQIEDKESSLGRALNEDEMVALLQQTGHPMRVAARYQPQQSLIGPTFFPIYKVVLKCVALFYLLPSFLVWIGLVLFVPLYHAKNNFVTVLNGYAGMWTNALLLFAIITLGFAALERFQSRITALQKWDPRKLPALAKRKERISRLETIFEIIFSVLFITAWFALPDIAHSLLAPVDKVLIINPVLKIYYWLGLIPAFLSLAQQLVNLFRPQWTWLRPPSRLVSTAMILGIVACMIRAYPYYSVANDLTVTNAQDAAHYAQVAFAINQISQWSLISFAIGLMIAVIVFAFQTVRIIRKHMNGSQGRSSVQISQVL